jgi:protein TonB
MTAEPALAAKFRLRPRPEPEWRPWVWLAAILLHAVIIALCFITIRQRPPPEAESPPGVSVVFDNGGTQQATAPPAQRQGPASMAQAPPPASLPPPAAETQPEVNLNMPEMPLSDLPAPAPAPQPQPQQPARRQPVHNPRPAPHYTVMNNMSFGQPSPPMPNARHGLNLDLSQSDLNVANGPEITIKGDVGADWNAALDQWVEDHKYYPDSALEQGQQGNVRIQFRVDRAGKVTRLHMVSGSGSPFLDQAWLGLFKDAQLPPFPPGAKANTVDIDATMHFILLP